MKRKIGFGLLSLVLLVAVFGAGSAYAIGCFTDTSTPAVCWMKYNGIVAPYADGSYRPGNALTRGDAANLLYNANRVPPAVGAIHLSQALTGLTPNGGSSGDVAYYTSVDVVSVPGAGTYTFQYHMAVPTSLYGKATIMKGVQLCYDATFGSATLSDVTLQVWNTDAATGANTLVASVDDATVRTDAACRKYMLAVPFQMAGTNHADIYLHVTSTGAAGQVYIGAATAMVSPSTVNASISAAGLDAASAPDAGTDTGAP